MREQSLGAGLLAGSQTALAPFVLHRPQSAEEAFEAFRNDPDATLLAGSTDIVAQMREGLSPRVVIALGGVTPWREILQEDDVLRLGALATHRGGPRDPVLRRTLPSLADAWASIATVRIRARATLGGNIMARQCRYETPLMLASLDAELELCGVDGEYRATIADLWRAETGLTGVLHHVRISTSDLLLFAYERTLRPLLTVALAVRARANGFRLTATVGSEYHPPVTAREDINGATVDSLDPEQVGRDLAGQLPDEIADYAATAAYRRRVVAVLVRRQLTAARSQPNTSLSA